jgi:hypothetical protein
MAEGRGKVVELQAVFTLPLVVETTSSVSTALGTSTPVRSTSINKAHAYLLRLSFLSTKVNTSVCLVV